MIEYKHGSDLLDWLMVRRIINRMKRGYSPVILLDGQPNSGKTVLSGLICQEIYYHFHKKSWPFEKLTFWDLDRLSDVIGKIHKSPILIPEAGYELAYDKWYSPHNRFYDIILQTQRVLGNCYIKNLPVDADLAKRHRRKTHYRVWVKGHGLCSWYDLQKRSRHKKVVPGGGVYMGTFRGYSHKDLKDWDKMRKLDEENKERILEKSRIKFKEDVKKGQAYAQRYKHECGRCKYEWSSHVEKPRQCPNYECRARLKFD